METVEIIAQMKKMILSNIENFAWGEKLGEFELFKMALEKVNPEFRKNAPQWINLQDEAKTIALQHFFKLAVQGYDAWFYTGRLIEIGKAIEVSFEKEVLQMMGQGFNSLDKVEKLNLERSKKTLFDTWSLMIAR
ncbi:MAG: hypothetical protein NTZ42_01790 [Candidatus Gribaldobacteria bacterium]|nr:hypothetical protein [Candidatus Gribaldobacteria bacterium]